jgi:hypothetical protein
MGFYYSFRDIKTKSCSDIRFCNKLENKSGSISVSLPLPVSLTVIIAWLCLISDVTTMDPIWVNLIALFIKLEITSAIL